LTNLKNYGIINNSILGYSESTINGGGCFLIPEEVRFLFAFLEKREVMPMYITWETLFLFCTLIVAIISLVFDIHNNKKR